jgi:hypothetical protein
VPGAAVADDGGPRRVVSGSPAARLHPPEPPTDALLQLNQPVCPYRRRLLGLLDLAAQPRQASHRLHHVASWTAAPATYRSRTATVGLNSHASGRRSGDQFCIYVFDRLVLPSLTRQQIQDAASVRLSLDALVRTFIRESLAYRSPLRQTPRQPSPSSGRSSVRDWGPATAPQPSAGCRARLGMIGKADALAHAGGDAVTTRVSDISTAPRAAPRPALLN